MAQRRPSRPSRFFKSWSVVWRIDFLNSGSASVQWPLSTRLTARSASARPADGVGLGDVCADAVVVATKRHENKRGRKKERIEVRETTCMRRLYAEIITH